LNTLLALALAALFLLAYVSVEVDAAIINAEDFEGYDDYVENFYNSEDSEDVEDDEGGVEDFEDYEDSADDYVEDVEDAEDYAEDAEDYAEDAEDVEDVDDEDFEGGVEDFDDTEEDAEDFEDVEDYAEDSDDAEDYDDEDFDGGVEDVEDDEGSVEDFDNTHTLSGNGFVQHVNVLHHVRPAHKKCFHDRPIRLLHAGTLLHAKTAVAALAKEHGKILCAHAANHTVVLFSTGETCEPVANEAGSWLCNVSYCCVPPTAPTHPHGWTGPVNTAPKHPHGWTGPVNHRHRHRHRHLHAKDVTSGTTVSD